MPDGPGENSMRAGVPARPDPLGLTGQAFARAMQESGLMARSNALAAYRKLHRSGEAHRLDPQVAPIAAVLREDGPEGEVIKFTQRVPATRAVTAAGEALPQDLRTESVLIPMLGRKGQRNYTLCVSSQVGCAMGCTSCETAQMGLIRSLTPAEIVGQWFAARHIIGIAPRNIVFMGMGEPLDNFDNVTAAIAILKDHDGPAVAISRITISTVGRLDGLARLRELIARPGWHRMGLAVSVNAPTDAVRSSIMPINRAMPMGELQQTLVEWPIYGGGKVCLPSGSAPSTSGTASRRAATATGPLSISSPTTRAGARPGPRPARRMSTASWAGCWTPGCTPSGAAPRAATSWAPAASWAARPSASAGPLRSAPR